MTSQGRGSLLRSPSHEEIARTGDPIHGFPSPRFLAVAVSISMSNSRPFLSSRGIGFGGAAHHTQCSCTKKWTWGK